VEDAGMGALRIAMLFGSAMIAIALLVTPFLDRSSGGVAQNSAAGVDVMSTGSIGAGSSYTIPPQCITRVPQFRLYHSQ
jgi:hypothetical protein